MNNYQQIVLNKLLDKYEASAHYKQNAISNRRVLLKCDSKNLPIYQFDDADRRDAFNHSMSELKENNIIDLSWERKGFLTNPEAYLESMERVAALPVNRVFPAHHNLDIQPEILLKMRGSNSLPTFA